MTPRGLIVVGALVALAALLLAAAGAGVQGPRPPACGGLFPPNECRDPGYWGGLALKGLALPVGAYGGILVAVGLGRKAQADDEAADAEREAASGEPGSE